MRQRPQTHTPFRLTTMRPCAGEGEQGGRKARHFFLPESALFLGCLISTTYIPSRVRIVAGRSQDSSPPTTPKQRPPDQHHADNQTKRTSPCDGCAWQCRLDEHGASLHAFGLQSTTHWSSSTCIIVVHPCSRTWLLKFHDHWRGGRGDWDGGPSYDCGERGVYFMRGGKGRVCSRWTYRYPPSSLPSSTTWHLWTRPRTASRLPLLRLKDWRLSILRFGLTSLRWSLRGTRWGGREGGGCFRE